eukprot:scaffold6454_cov66-Phaeocystis_antarctica.AAC.3
MPSGSVSGASSSLVRKDAEIFDGGMVVLARAGRVGADAARPSPMIVELLHPEGPGASLPFPNPRAAPHGIGGGGGGGGGDGHG